MPGAGIDDRKTMTPLTLTRIAATFSTAAGLLVLLGWILDIPQARSLIPGTISMKANTAISFVVAGASIWLVAGGRGQPRALVVGRLLGLAVAVAGALNLIEYVFGVDLGIDQLLFVDRDPATAYPGRMSLPTAVAFVAAGGALAFIDARPRGRWLAGFLAVATGSLGYLGLIGYALGVDIVRIVTLQNIALNTGVALLVVAFGILTARADRGLGRLLYDPGPGPLLIRRLLPFAFVITPAFAVLRLAGERAGLYSPATGSAVFTVVMVTTILGILVWTARSLDAVDAARRQALERLGRFFALSQDMLVITDAEGRFTMVSGASRHILGRAPEDLVGRPLLEFVHPDDRGRTEAEFRREIAEGRATLAFVNRYLHADGGTRSIEWTSRFNEDDGFVYAVARDISDRLEAEAAVMAAREEAVAANKAKTEFLSRMSHELRTPLNAVIGFGQLLELDNLDRTQRESVHQILAGGRHLLELIDEILDISRIESRRLSMSPEPVSMQASIDNAVKLMAPLAAERGVRLESGSPPTAAHVLADRQRLSQVLLNLLSNGVKYNRPGGVVTVTAAPATGPNGVDHLRVAVADDGHGIDAALLARLFAPFERLGMESSGVEGTGLGLSLSKGLIEAMNGRIGVDSKPGMGATFWFSLPLVSPAAAAETIDERVEAAPAVAAVEGARERTLLYIEDNPSNYRLVERAMERRPGFRIIAAMLGSLGLDLAREHRPDVILLDLHLPDLSGEDVLARLRAEPATEQIPVVVLSADAASSVRDRLLARGATGYLAKPIDLGEFYRVIDAVGGGHAGQAATATITE